MPIGSSGGELSSNQDGQEQRHEHDDHHVMIVLCSSADGFQPPSDWLGAAASSLHRASDPGSTLSALPLWPCCLRCVKSSALIVRLPVRVWSAPGWLPASAARLLYAIFHRRRRAVSSFVGDGPTHAARHPEQRPGHAKTNTRCDRLGLPASVTQSFDAWATAGHNNATQSTERRHVREGHDR